MKKGILYVLTCNTKGNNLSIFSIFSKPTQGRELMVVGTQAEGHGLLSETEEEIAGREGVDQHHTVAHSTLAGKVPLCTVDGYTVAFSINNGIMRSGLELVDYCDLP
jgi:hypothetical protein